MKRDMLWYSKFPVCPLCGSIYKWRTIREQTAMWAMRGRNCIQICVQRWKSLSIKWTISVNTPRNLRRRHFWVGLNQVIKEMRTDGDGMRTEALVAKSKVILTSVHTAVKDGVSAGIESYSSAVSGGSKQQQPQQTIAFKKAMHEGSCR